MVITKKDITEMVMSQNETDSPITSGQGTGYGQEIKNGVSKMKTGAKEIGGSIVNGIMNVLSKEEKGHFTNKNVFLLLNIVFKLTNSSDPTRNIQLYLDFCIFK